jgi:hypothetical protein
VKTRAFTGLKRHEGVWKRSAAEAPDTKHWWPDGCEGSTSPYDRLVRGEIVPETPCIQNYRVGTPRSLYGYDGDVRFEVLTAASMKMTDCLLSCCAMKSGRSLPMFQRCLLPPSSGRWDRAARTSETSVNLYQTTRRNKTAVFVTQMNSAPAKNLITIVQTVSCYFVDSYYPMKAYMGGVQVKLQM